MKKCPNCNRLNPDEAYVCVCGFSNLANISSTNDTVSPPFSTIYTYLTPAILTSIFCCSPFGVVGIYYAGKTKSRLEVGDTNGALEFSKEARRWCWIAFGLGLGGWILYLLIIIVIAASGIK